MAAILIVEDNATLRDGLTQLLRTRGHAVEAAHSVAAARALLAAGTFDLVVSDYRLEDGTGIDLLTRIKQSGLAGEPDFIMITGYGTIDIAVESMRLGAWDFLTKPLDSDAFRMKVEKALEVRATHGENRRLDAENAYLRGEVEERFGDIVGRSPQMQAIFGQIQKIAPTHSSVLLTGESGTGKELVARAIHRQSPRAGGPFIRVNCSALAETLLESELFGHERGAFTGAVRERRGRFELAHGGTLFLDEVADIPPSVQIKLLRVLQEKELERVGGERTIRVDVRILSATNRDLAAAVESGGFREDLFYRLHIVPLRIPPLREREGDIELLVRHFIRAISKETGKRITGITDEALAHLRSYPWPGNVRELENAIERAIVLCDGEQLGPGEFPMGDAPGLAPQSLAGNGSLDGVLAQTERRLIQEALDKAGGVKTRTAEILGIKTSALYYKLEKYGLLP
ncbi:MAG: sigma-54-dependent Fis family transcriptional regulator [Gemmatimonadetes bacterium]|nr:sigma-54-dependent Fis family transcriptional regulator [Gemmatimonadota bacterium]